MRAVSSQAMRRIVRAVLEPRPRGSNRKSRARPARAAQVHARFPLLRQSLPTRTTHPFAVLLSVDVISNARIFATNPNTGGAEWAATEAGIYGLSANLGGVYEHEGTGTTWANVGGAAAQVVACP